MKDRKKRLLAIASSGGHWVQLMRLRPSWDDCDVAYMTTELAYRDETILYAEERGLNTPRFYKTLVATRWQKFRLIRQLLDIMWVLVKERPDVVVSTGAAPGFFALSVGKLIGAKTIWIDSIANAEELSLSGQKICPHADVCLTQWPELAGDDTDINSPKYWGAVL
jgi:UDP-N-acetylglucosamine:LPS N-acetylglucosamine transferase